MTGSSLDRESFQSLLACAFTLQHTLLDVQSPSTILEIQHLIVTRQLDLKMAMRLIAGCARSVANATGVAIGLLESNQLAYIAGSGSATARIGRHVSATLTVATNTRDKAEILRVENAEKETRIEAAICRQFGAKSLLILPIYCDPALAGIIEIFFNEAHVFHDREVGTYHLIAGLAGDALACSRTFEKKTMQSTTVAMPPETRKRVLNNDDLPRKIRSLPNVRFSCPACGAGIESDKLAPRQAGLVHPNNPLKRAIIPLRSRLHRWKLGDPAAVIIVLFAAGWIAYSSGRSGSSFTDSARQTQDAHQDQKPLLSTRSQPINESRRQSEAILTDRVTKTGRRTPQHVVIGDQEIDYVSEDVTVRHFMPKTAVNPLRKPGDRRAKRREPGLHE